MSEAIDFTALDWVRQELNGTLRQARRLFEDYTEHAGGDERLQDCMECLHQVRGPLQMVELSGAGQLVQEMEELLEALLQGRIENSPPALDVLMQGFLQLPDYLSRLRHGRKDVPAVLLPLINRLRSARGEEPLSGMAVFNPDLTLPVPDSAFNVHTDEAADDIQELARSLRQSYQAGLLGWFRGESGDDGLQKMLDVLDKLQLASRVESCARLWWFAAGLAEALLSGALQPSAQEKHLFGKIEREIQHLIDAGEDAFARAVPRQLLQELLFSILQAGSASGRVEEVMRVHAPADADAGVAAESLAGRSQEVLDTVAEAAGETLGQIKAGLDDFLRSGTEEPEELAGIATAMHELGNIVTMIGLEEDVRVLAENERLVGEMAAGRVAVDESRLLSVADAVLAIESGLNDVHVSERALMQQETTQGLAYRQGLEAVTREAVADMLQVKDLISDYLLQPEDSGLLKAVPGLLKQLRGGMQLAGQERTARLVEQLNEYISNVLLEGAPAPDEAQLDTLADAICSIEYYINELRDNRIYGGMVLDVAEKSLVKLGYPGMQSPAQLPEVRQEDIPVVPDTVPGESAGCVITGLQVVDPEADEEILAIFFEEAGEQLTALAEMIPLWAASPGETGRLVGIRRAFHTLKGGSRMLGALALGEFACVFENLFNRVNEGSIVPGDELFSLASQVHVSLDELLAQIKGGPAPQSDVDGMAAAALVLAHSGETDAGCALSAFGEDSGKLDVAVAVADDLPVLAGDADPEITEIFIEEAGEVLATLCSLLPAWLEDAHDGEALESVRRCFHTLKGSGRMAGAMLLGEFAWAIENLLNRVIDGSVDTSAEVTSLLGQVSGPLAELVSQVGGGPQPAVDIQALMESALRLASGESTGHVADDVLVTDSVAGDATCDCPPVQETEMLPHAIEPGQVNEEPALVEIFRNECRGHLQALHTFIEACERSDRSLEVTEPLYRALHTLASTAQSAEVPAIHALAADLYNYFDALMLVRQPVGQEPLEILGACTAAIAELVDQLPDTAYNTGWLRSLQSRIAALPEVEQAGNDMPAAVVEEVAAAEECENETVAAVSGEGLVTVKEEADAAVLSLSQTLPVDPYADVDPELFEVFLEEAEEIIDGSEVTLRDWSKEPGRLELMDEFKRQLHTLKGGARMVDIGAIGNLSHSLESLVTRIVDGHLETSATMFSLLHEAHDRLATMLEKVKMREIPEEGADLEELLDTLEPESDTAGAAETAAVSAGDGVDEIVTVPASGEMSDASGESESSEMSATAAGDGMDEMATVPASGETSDATGESETSEAPAMDAVSVAAVTTAGVDAQADAGSPSGAAHEPGPDSELAAMTIEQPEPRPMASALEATATRAEPGGMSGERTVPPQIAERRKPSRVRGEQVRVQSGLLDNLVNFAGEINIYRSRIDQQVGAYRFNLAELERTINRLRDQLRQFEIEAETQILFRYEHEGGQPSSGFDPLEMDRYSNLQQQSRSLLESISDLRSIQELLDSTTRETETLLLQQSRVSTDLQEGLLRTRMIPFAGIAPRLRRIVRQSAHETGKQVELKLDGAEGEMDRTVTERIIAPLEHMLRNAVDHGIETPEQRGMAGKPETGTIRIAFHREGPEIVLRIEDDGKGLNHEAIRARAIERGLIPEHATLTESEVVHFILQTGFSTASEVTQISGRGVGMDVVNSEVKQLGGSLHIDSDPGRGSVFTVRLPYTLAINQVLLVRTSVDTYCIPLGNIEGVVRVDPRTLAASYQAEEAVFEYGGNTYQLQHLGTLLNRGSMELEGIQESLPVLLIHIGEKRVALQVEGLIGNREIVVKPLGVQLSRVNGVSGATILGDGRVVMILDVAALVRMGNKPAEQAIDSRKAGDEKLLVMVVDDSITVRKVTTRLLERSGYGVITARDGLDAIGQLEETVPDLMLLDIEMPRMDGFELATHMRNDERYRHIPITMITSRTGDKHRERAAQIGIDHYLGKPYQEHELLATIHSLTGIPDSGEPARNTWMMADGYNAAHEEQQDE